MRTSGIVDWTTGIVDGGMENWESKIGLLEQWSKKVEKGRER